MKRARLARTWACTSDSLSSAPGPHHHERAQPLAELLVGHADHRDLLDALVVGQQVLDLAGEHVLAAADDHFVVAPLDEQAALGVEAAHVAGAHQPVDDLLAAAAGVALEDHLVADEDAAGLVPEGPLARCSSSSFTTVPSGGRPAVPGAARRSSGVAIVAHATSVEP